MPAHKRRGFTLIELMVVITIIAILATIGFVTYSGSQKVARDSRRKQDLKAIATAPELYRQKYNRYPCPGDNTWLNSSGGGSWITDLDFSNCSDSARHDLDSTYINSMPSDPLNSGPSYVWSNSASSYYYGYRGYVSSLCSSSKGQFYLLVAELENTSDTDRNAVKQVKDCDGSVLSGTGWNTAFVLSSP